MKLVILSIQNNKESWAIEAIESFKKKIIPIIKIEYQQLKSTKKPRAQALEKIADEEQLLLKKIESHDLVIALDEKGKNFANSRSFSKFLVQQIESGRSRIVFVIGGAYGLGPQIKQRASLCMSLSGLTFNHHLAQVLLSEQIYRALSIWRGLPYHND